LAKIANGLILVEKLFQEQSMPTRNVNLTPELDNFISAKIESGRYENASEVVRAALRELEREEKEYDLKMAALTLALEEGLASGVAEGDVFEEVLRDIQNGTILAQHERLAS
jgi:antitoxin ParD1/3/4